MLTSVAQNEWILDGDGNYLYRHDCIVAYINVGTQRKIVQDRHQHTIVNKSKADICKSKLERFVVLPDDTATFEEWWAITEIPQGRHSSQMKRIMTKR